MTYRSYIGNQNSTLGSVVPLAMFHMLLLDANRPQLLEKKSELSWQSLMKMIDWMFALLNSWFLRQPYSHRAFLPGKPETNFLNFIEEASRASPWAPHTFYAHLHLFFSINPFKPSHSLWQEHDIVG